MSEAEETPEENYDWLTESLFEPIIEKELSGDAPTDYELKLTSIKPAVGKGENYIGLVTRVELEVKFTNMLDRKPKTYNFIVKSSKANIQEFEEMGVFEKEINFYEEVARKFQNFDDSITFLPKCYSIMTQDRQIIILHDLLASGYKMQSRVNGLDLEHCTLFYKTIGQFHALSAAYYEKFGRYPEIFHQSVYRIEFKEMFSKWENLLFPEFLDIFDRYDSLKPYREIFHKWKNTAFEAVCDITKEKPDEFNVLNHGDGWVNNMMYRHDEDNRPTEVCFVDFQLAVYGTPMIDLLYFFASSPTVDVREHHFDELLYVYHTSLVEHLKKYNYSKPIPTMRELQIMVLKHGLLGSYFLNGIAPVVLLDPKDTRPAEFFIKESDEANTFRYNLYNSPRYIKTLEVALKFFHRRGLLEI